MIEIAGAQGAWLDTRDRRRILDGISSWWVVTHGHCHPRIVAAIKHKAGRLDQVIFAGFTHEPAETLARGLIDIAPPGLEHVFFSDSGSTSVEVALKMALGYWRNIGEQRRRIVALEHGYHGDTVGGMSVGARGVFSATYEPLLFDVVRIPFPAPGREQETHRRLRCRLRRRAGRRADRRAADPRRRWHADLRGTRAARVKAYRRGARRPAHRRRGDDRLGPHGRAIRLQQGRRRARHPLPCQGDHRRLTAAGGDALHAGDLRGASLHGPHQDVLPFELVHGKSDRLRGRHCQPRDLADRAGGRTHRRARGRPRRTPSAIPRRRSFRQRPPARHHRRARPCRERRRLPRRRRTAH